MKRDTRKASEILATGLQQFEGGKRWVPAPGNCETNFCALNVIGLNDAPLLWLIKAVGLEQKPDSENFSEVADWNDSAPDFSVIEAGFRKAIELAKAEGQ